MRYARNDQHDANGEKLAAKTQKQSVRYQSALFFYPKKNDEIFDYFKIIVLYRYESSREEKY